MKLPFLKNKTFAAYSENLAAKWLRNKGYKIVKRNFRFRLGEIDIIAQKEGQMHFVEVKARRSLNYGEPSEAVNSSKVKKIIKTAEVFLKYFPEFEDYDLKFDLISISYYDKKAKIDFIEDIVL